MTGSGSLAAVVSSSGRIRYNVIGNCTADVAAMAVSRPSDAGVRNSSRPASSMAACAPTANRPVSPSSNDSHSPDLALAHNRPYPQMNSATRGRCAPTKPLTSPGRSNRRHSSQ